MSGLDFRKGSSDASGFDLRSEMKGADNRLYRAFLQCCHERFWGGEALAVVGGVVGDERGVDAEGNLMCGDGCGWVKYITGRLSCKRWSGRL